jgi:hypothetical protein
MCDSFRSKPWRRCALRRRQAGPGLALTLPDLETRAMKPNRRRRHAWCEVHGIRGLCRCNALTASIARTSPRILARAAPQRTLRQRVLREARADGECCCNNVHVGPAAPLPLLIERLLTLRLRRAERQHLVDDCGVCAWLLRRPRRHVCAPRKSDRLVRSGVMCFRDRNFSACLPWPMPLRALSGQCLPPSQSLANREAGPTCRVFYFSSE